MNKTIIGIIVIILVAGGIYYASMDKDVVMTEEKNMMKEDLKKDDGMMKEKAVDNDSMMKKDENAMTEKSDVMTTSGSYETYSPEKLALADNGDVVLFFRASWCPTCRALDADIKANTKNIPVGVVILDVNYDTSTALKQKYGVTYQHTLVQVDSSGNQIVKWMGSPTLASILPNIK